MKRTVIAAAVAALLATSGSAMATSYHNSNGIPSSWAAWFSWVIPTWWAPFASWTTPVVVHRPRPVQPAAHPVPPRPAPAVPPASPAAPAPAPSSTGFANRLYELTNQERQRAGLPPLTRNACLQTGAQQWSTAQASTRSMRHNSLGWMRTQCGMSYYGENVAMGYTTPEAMMRGWMNSPGHRANILNRNYTAIGIGYDARNRGYATQNFGR